MSNIAVRMIEWYQVQVSPHKGFRCAYGVQCGAGTCSSIVKRAFVSRGAWAGSYTILVQAVRCCRAAVALHISDTTTGGSVKPVPEPQTNAEPDIPKSCAQYAAMEGIGWCCFLPFIS